MAFTIPYNTEIFTSKVARDVEFDLVHPGMLELVRLRFVQLATDGLVSGISTPEFEASTLAALKDASPVFEQCVRAVRGLTAPAALCRRVGVAVPESAGAEDPIAIENGHQFARAVSFLLPLALEVAFRILALTAKQSVQNGVVVPAPSA